MLAYFKRHCGRDSSQLWSRLHKFHAPSFLRGLLVSFVSVAVATQARLTLEPLVGDEEVFTLFFAAIAFTAWFGGYCPTILSVALSYLVADLLFLGRPNHLFDYPHWRPSDFIGSATLAFSGLAIAFTRRALASAKDRAESRQRELEKAQAELKVLADSLEKRVEERTIDLTETINSLEGVCYHIAHDLRAPLRGMKGFADLLLANYSPYLNTAGKDYAKRISQAADRMDRLIRDILDYGRLGHVQFSSHEVDLERLVDRALAELDTEIRSKNAQIDVQHPLPHVWADSTLLLQILHNLLGNALKFVPPHTTPRVLIGTAEKETCTRLWIRDNGIGIAPEFHAKVFNIFERLPEGNDYPGTGIGLAIVAKAVEKMKGKVGVESTPQQGSCFWLELPIHGVDTLSALPPRHPVSL
jgi:signal transduction histidine kinase